MSKDPAKLSLALVEMGNLSFPLKPIADLLNQAQNYAKFYVADSVTQIGDPDMGSYEYSFAKLARLASIRKRVQDDYVVAITSVPIQYNYFSTSLNKSIIITTYDADRLMSEAQRPIEKYIALEIVANLLSSEYYRVGGLERDLWHSAPSGCIFDLAGNKRDIIRKVREAKLESVCQGTFDKANVPRSLVQASKAILDEIRKTSLLESAKTALENPIAGFLFGGVVTSAFLEIIGQFSPIARSYSAPALLAIFVVFVLGVRYRQNRRPT